MSVRRKGLAAAGALAVGLGGWVATGPAAGDRHDDRWWGPPHDVRRTLDQIDARSLQRYDHALVGFGTRHTLSTQTDPAARDRRRARLHQGPVRRDRADVGRADDGRAAELRPAAAPPRIPTATTITQRRRHAQGHRPGVGRPRLRRRRALRLAPHRRPRRHRRRARRQRRRLRHVRGARARAGAGAEADRGDDRVRRPTPERSRACTAPTTSPRSPSRTTGTSRAS